MCRIKSGELAPTKEGTRSGSPCFEDPSASEDPEDHSGPAPQG
jgi:hypothetical protein